MTSKHRFPFSGLLGIISEETELLVLISDVEYQTSAAMLALYTH
jgi:hypothetical protein